MCVEGSFEIYRIKNAIYKRTYCFDSCGNEISFSMENINLEIYIS
jgi:hypothetical protein